jgi:WXG100 family type VII secretion target
MNINESTPILVAPELEAAGTYLNGQAGEIAAELAQLAGYVSQLEPFWQGKAATYYQGLQAEWNTAADGLFGPEGVLGEIARAMNVNWANYSDAEWSNTVTWQRS